jgi:hypothetical protein
MQNKKSRALRTVLRKERLSLKRDFIILIFIVWVYGVYLLYIEGGMLGIYFLIFANSFAMLSFFQYYLTLRRAAAKLKRLQLSPYLAPLDDDLDGVSYGSSNPRRRPRHTPPTNYRNAP